MLVSIGNHNLHLQNNNSNPFFSVLKTFIVSMGCPGGSKRTGLEHRQQTDTGSRQAAQIIRCTDIKGEVETCYKILESNRRQPQFDGNGGWIEVMYV